jgi:hypothetical protein
MTHYALLASDGITEIAREVGRTEREALMIFGKRAEINHRLELCDDPSAAEFFLKWFDAGRCLIEPVRASS